MSHDEAFADFVARKRAREAKELKVTWRRVSDMTGGGFSGLGPDGELVYVVKARPGVYEYGRVLDGSRVSFGEARGASPELAKAAAAALFEEARA